MRNKPLLQVCAKNVSCLDIYIEMLYDGTLNEIGSKEDHVHTELTLKYLRCQILERIFAFSFLNMH